MQIPGERVQRTRLIQRGRFVVALPVELVIPFDDPDEPCLEAATVELIRQVAEHAERGDVGWLQQHGQVYELVEAA